jgi:hypothetical protein
VFSPELARIHARIEVLEQFNRDTRLLVLDQAWWRANPLGMLLAGDGCGACDVGRREPASCGAATDDRHHAGIAATRA